MSNVKTMFYRSSIMVATLTMLFHFTMSAGQPLEVEILSSLQVKYLGGDNEALFFNIKYDNRAGKNFKLVVLDETGEALYENNYRKDLDKKLKVPRLTDSEHVIFVIKPDKGKTELSYKVKVTTKVVDNASLVKR